jgi:hypothetical protein
VTGCASVLLSQLCEEARYSPSCGHPESRYKLLIQTTKVTIISAARIESRDANSVYTSGLIDSI